MCGSGPRAEGWRPDGGDCAMTRGPLPAAGLLALRDQALDALDGGDVRAALALADAGTAAIEAAGPGGGADAAALLIARAEIEEAWTASGTPRSRSRRRSRLLADGAAADGDDDDLVVLWCQAQERLAGLERMSGDLEPAAARLGAVLDRAARELGETSRAVVSAANALGVVHKYAADFDAAQACYERAMAAAGRWAEPDPLIMAGLLHNLGGLAHSRGDAGGGIPLAERGVGAARRGGRRRASRRRPRPERAGRALPARRAPRRRRRAPMTGRWRCSRTATAPTTSRSA